MVTFGVLLFLFFVCFIALVVVAARCSALVSWYCRGDVYCCAMSLFVVVRRFLFVFDVIVPPSPRLYSGVMKSNRRFTVILSSLADYLSLKTSAVGQFTVSPA